MKMKKENMGLIGIALVLGAFMCYRFFQEYNDNKLLEDSITTKGILLEIEGTGVKSSAYGAYYYYVNKIRYENEDRKDFTDLKVGDTILVEYSKKDPSISRVVDKHYMKRYR